MSLHNAHENDEMTSRAGNAFADPNAPTVADLLTCVDGNPQLSPRQQREICSALKALGKWFRLPPEAIPANLSFLRRKLAAVHPASAGISERRVQNVRSLVLKAFRVAGLPAVEASYLCPMTAAWQRLYDLLPGKYERCALGRFMRFCSAQGIAPIAVCDDTFRRFLQALVEETLVRHPKRDHQTACRLWNRMRERIDGWPDVAVTVPRYRTTYAVAWNDLHPDLRTEIEAYLATLDGSDLFAATGLARPLRPASVRQHRGNIARYLGALAATGHNVREFRSLSQLADFETFRTAMRWLWNRNGGHTSEVINSIAWAVRCIAVRYLGCDDDTAARYADAMRRLSPDRQGLSDKNRAVLDRFDDPDLVRCFLTVPQRLREQVARMTKGYDGRSAALLVQQALAIELLIFAPMRLGNLVSLHLERHLAWLQTRDEPVLVISIPAEEVKNREPLSFKLPPETSKRVQSYVEEWRPRLLAEPSPFLFPGRNGSHKDQSCLSKRITEAVWNEAGVRITPHQFRHIAAKLHLDRHPGQYEVVRRLLGHKSVSTTYSHYAGAETKAAVAHYQETILGLQRLEPGPDVPCTARSNRQDGTRRRSSGRNGARPREAAER